MYDTHNNKFHPIHTIKQSSHYVEGLLTSFIMIEVCLQPLTIDNFS